MLHSEMERKCFSEIQRYLIQGDEERLKKYLARAEKIKKKQGELTWKNPESANYWSVHLLWL